MKDGQTANKIQIVKTRLFPLTGLQKWYVCTVQRACQAKLMKEHWEAEIFCIPQFKTV